MACTHFHMSKKYRGKPCVYCVEQQATQADHVFAREFFNIESRVSLPKVPACQACNHAKSKLEHYLTSILPFGGQHDGALKTLSDLVPARLAKNAALHRRLRSGQTRIWAKFGELYVPTTALPIESEKIDQLFRFIVKGLAWYHWNLLLKSNVGIWAGVLSFDGERLFKKLLELTGHRISSNLGKGAFVYEGLQATGNPEMSIWTFSIYGGLVLGGDPNEPKPKPTLIGGQTAPKDVLQRFLELANAKS